MNRNAARSESSASRSAQKGFPSLNRNIYPAWFGETRQRLSQLRSFRFLRRLGADTPAIASMICLIAIVMFVVFGPLVLPHSAEDLALARALEPPSADYWLGTDNLGRDMLALMADGGRLSLLAAFWATATSVFVGMPLGLVAGYRGGRADRWLMRLNDTLMSFPPLILAIAIVGFLGPGLRNAMIAIGIVYAPRFARVTRAATLAVREEVYLEGARAIGATHRRMLISHVTPNILSPLLVQFTLTLGLSILAEAGLSFLGLGAQLPRASWGALLSGQMRYINQAPLNVITPSLAIMIVVLCFQLLGDGLRDSLGKTVHRLGGN